MTLLDIQTFTFSVRDCFQVDISSTDTEYSIWLYHPSCGIKVQLWAEPKKQPISAGQTPISDLIPIAEAIAEEAIADYKAKYMD